MYFALAGRKAHPGCMKIKPYSVCVQTAAPRINCVDDNWISGKGLVGARCIHPLAGKGRGKSGL